jgi:3D (Asp-Asp-Asp) domain-containing protein
MGCKIDVWWATATSSGGVRRLVVIGEGTCTQGGFTLRLEPTNEGIVDDPEVIALRLIVTAPELGTDVMTPAYVEHQAEVGGAVNRVRIDTPDGTHWVDIEG